jgi:hypothetical protein
MNGNGKADVVFQNSAGQLMVWIMNGTAFVSSAPLKSVGAGWRLAGFADFNGNNSTDFLWQNDDGRLALWYMSGINFAGGVSLRGGQPVAAGWLAKGAN